jgi:hypothetical protein
MDASTPTPAAAPAAPASPRPVRTQARGLRQPQTSVLPPHAGGAARRTALPPVYAAMVGDLKARYKISIRKWRSHMAGVAYELTYRDGRIKRLVSAPRPRSPVSAAIFLHEVGHHAVGFRRYSPRCLEEYYVWQWTFREMTARGIPVTHRVLRHYRRAMYHYVHRARLAHPLPPELAPFTHWPG